jgi:hypothetical protein
MNPLLLHPGPKFSRLELDSIRKDSEMCWNDQHVFIADAKFLFQMHCFKGSILWANVKFFLISAANNYISSTLCLEDSISKSAWMLCLPIDMV